MSSLKRSRAAAGVVQSGAGRLSKQSKGESALAVSPSSPTAACLLGESMEQLHSAIYPTGKKDASTLTTFQRRVYALTRRIPAGKVATYKSIAESLNAPRAYRAVGNALRHNPFAPQVPCHRVLASDCSIGGFAGSFGPCALTERKMAMLRAEGVQIDTIKRAVKLDQAYRAQAVLRTIDARNLDQDISDEKLSAL